MAVVELKNKEGCRSQEAQRLLKEIRDHFTLNIDDIELRDVYYIQPKLSDDELESVAQEALLDPIIQDAAINPANDSEYDWILEFGPKDGVTDNLGSTAQLAIQDRLEKEFKSGEEVRSSRRVYVRGKVRRGDLEKFAVGTEKPKIGSRPPQSTKLGPICHVLMKVPVKCLENRSTLHYFVMFSMSYDSKDFLHLFFLLPALLRLSTVK